MKYKIAIITIFILLWTGAAFSQNNKKPTSGADGEVLYEVTNQLLNKNN